MRTLNLSIQVTDEELSNLLAKFAERGTLQTGTAADDDSGAGDLPADPNTLDANGVPWLEGIHASTKGKTKEGLWRGAKGVTVEMRKAAEDKWKAGQSSQSFPVPGSVALGGQPIAVPLAPSAPAPQPMAMPGFPMPAMPSMPAAPPPPVSYEQMIAKFQALFQSGKLNEQGTVAIYGRCQITDPAVLLTNESARRAIMSEFEALERAG